MISLVKWNGRSLKHSQIGSGLALARKPRYKIRNIVIIHNRGWIDKEKSYSIETCMVPSQISTSRPTLKDLH